MSNTIRYGDLFTKWVIPFWDDNMPPRRFRASKKYKSIHSWSSFVPEKSLAYSWMRFVGDLKFGSLAALLRAAGQRQPAEGGGTSASTTTRGSTLGSSSAFATSRRSRR